MLTRGSLDHFLTHVSCSHYATKNESYVSSVKSISEPIGKIHKNILGTSEHVLIIGTRRMAIHVVEAVMNGLAI